MRTSLVLRHGPDYRGNWRGPTLHHTLVHGAEGGRFRPAPGFGGDYTGTTPTPAHHSQHRMHGPNRVLCGRRIHNPHFHRHVPRIVG